MKATRALLFTLLGVLLGACGSTGAEVPDPTSAIVETSFSGLVDIGDGRRLYLESRGSGSPTVVLIAGKGVDGDDWNQILDPDDPAHDTPGDDVGAGMGLLEQSQNAVLPTVAGFTKVCAYDRPDTRLSGPNLSTPASQPHSVERDVQDLHALLEAAHLPAPYVLVAHSYGGFIAALYARRYPNSVAGLVMVDAAAVQLKEAMTPEELAGWDAEKRLTFPSLPEGVQLIEAIELIEAAPPPPKVPTVILSADKPYRIDLLPPEAETFLTFDDWLTAQDLLAAALEGRQIKNTNSGHHVYLYRPELVVEAIREVVDRARVQP